MKRTAAGSTKRCIYQLRVFCIIFASVKTSFVKFIVASIVVIGALGCMQGDSFGTSFFQEDEAVVINVSVENIRQEAEAQTKKQAGKQGDDDKNDFVFQFPNIFDVFRPLFQ